MVTEIPQELVQMVLLFRYAPDAGVTANGGTPVIDQVGSLANILATVLSVLTAVIAAGLAARLFKFRPARGERNSLDLEKTTAQLREQFATGDLQVETPLPDTVTREQITVPRRSDATLADRSYKLLREYSAQGLAQSKVSFRVSLVFAGLGFFVIIIGVLLSVSRASVEQALI